MKYNYPLLVVTDLERSKKFYQELFGMRVIMDFGANITLTGGVCLQEKQSWAGLIQQPEEEIVFGGKDAELYFEEERFDEFVARLHQMADISLVHPVIEHRWGQRAIRLYDPDRHIIEIGEEIRTVCRRFLDSGMTKEQVAERMDVPLKFVNACIR